MKSPRHWLTTMHVFCMQQTKTHSLQHFLKTTIVFTIVPQWGLSSVGLCHALGVLAFRRRQRQYATSHNGILHFIMCFANNFINAQVNSLSQSSKHCKKSCRIQDTGPRSSLDPERFSTAIWLEEVDESWVLEGIQKQSFPQKFNAWKIRWKT